MGTHGQYFCVVCHKYGSTVSSTSILFKFPSSLVRKTQWIKSLQLSESEVTSKAKVCEKHFKKDQFSSTFIKRNAIPTIKLFKSPSLNINTYVPITVPIILNQPLPTVNEPGTCPYRIILPKSSNIYDEGEKAATTNVGVEDEGLEKAVICKLIRGGHKPTGELCLICAQLPDPLETNQPPLVNYQLSSFLNPHLWSMFVLKLLNFPTVECKNVFIKTFGVNPGDWFRLCGPCFAIVEQAYMLEKEVAKLQKKLERVKSNATKKLEESLKLDKSSAAKTKSHGVFDISKYIRQVLKDPNKQLMESKAAPLIISVNENDKIKVFDDSQNPPKNETDTSERTDIEVHMTNIIVKTENDEEENSLIIADHDSPEITGNNTNDSSKFNHNNKIKRKMAKKLKLTAIKRCRVPESQDQKPPNTSSKNTSNFPRSNRTLPTRLTCSLCPAKFVRRLNLKFHLDSHKKYKETSCPKCNFPCENPKRLKRHLTLKRCTFQGQGSSLFALSSDSHENHEKCHICDRIYPTKIQLTKHIKRHSKYKNTTCTVCKLPCGNRRKLEIHMEICNAKSNQAEEFKCDLCGYTTDYPNTFARHKRLHKLAKFNCELCSFPSSSLEWLTIHMKEMHVNVITTPNGDNVNQVEKGQDMYSCHLCPAMFSSILKVDCHVRNVHEKRHPCFKCASTFESRSQLRNHLSEKHGIEKTMLICDICGMQFTEHPALYKHTKKFHLSSIDKPKSGDDGTVGGNEVSKYERKCPHCQISCCNATALKIHLRANHPELYKYKCEQCPLTYISSTNLKIHVKNVHLKETVECEKCKAIMKGSSMRDHLKLFCKYRTKPTT